MIGSLFGWIFGGAREARALGQTVTSVAEVFRPNATRALELGHDAYKAAHASHTAEFQYARGGWFDSAVNGLNRLPRPLLALGTLGLFVYAMADPDGFAIRMLALSNVPEPLWWLLGAVVAFYFGAREAHHLRVKKVPAPPLANRLERPEPVQDSGSNPALAEWSGAKG
ncbi:holin family protein [Roseinatronobacter monicus]|uniref:holin family protein n=1 Tax=Roseinatronobacter monicus TaxID=393481 RepID=UPI003F36F283